jgi:membrane associated rhomboid family serine protease
MFPIGTNLQLKNIPAVTIALIIINTITFIIECLFIEYFNYDPFVTFFSSMFSAFLHVDFFHLFGNMLFLWVFGSYLEDKIGSKRFLFYYFICEIGAGIFHLVFDGSPAIGASGAISGVMGIYLYRCHYSKIKTIIPVLLWYVKVNINATWFLLFWILRDVYDSLYSVDYVAYWAHIGGYITGIIIGKINNYWKEAKIEHLYERATDSINKKWGLTEAEEDLLKILKIDPENPEVNLELARYFSEHNEKKVKGKKYYLASARAYYLKNKTKRMAGEVFLEYLDKYRASTDPQIHLKYAHTLSNECSYYDASKILKPLIDTNDLKGAIGERIFLNYINNSLKAGLKKPAQSAYEKFTKLFPDSLLRKKAESLIRTYIPKSKKKVQIEKAARPNRWAGIMENINDTTADPLFWFLILITINLLDAILIVPAAILSFAMTFAVRNFASFFGSIYEGRHKSEEEGLRDFNTSFYMDKAISCERDEKFDDAIEYFNAVIEEEKKCEIHLEARYKIARLYHKKLNQPLKAINEYKIISNIAPKGHPFRRDAYEGIKELSQINPLGI